MKKRPFLMAFLLVGAVFVFFFLSVLIITTFLGRPSAFPVGEKVAILDVEGIIQTSRAFNQRLIELREDESVKAIVLRVDSPGGAVGPSQEIYTEVKRTARVKPVVVSMGSVAASGGYYIAAPAQRILANPGTITGSIGVIMEFTNIEELLGKLGLKSQVVKSGEHKDLGSPTRPMSAQDRKIFQALIDDVHQQFTTAIAEGRKMDLNKVESLADGRVFSGNQALKAGLVDELGNLQDAIRVAGKLGGITGDPNVIYPSHKERKLLDYLLEQGAVQFQRALQSEAGYGMQYIWTGFE